MNVLNLLRKTASPAGLANEALEKVPNRTDRIVACANVLMVAEKGGKGYRVHDKVSETACDELVAHELLARSSCGFFAFCDPVVAKNIAKNYTSDNDGFLVHK